MVFYFLRSPFVLRLHIPFALRPLSYAYADSSFNSAIFEISLRSSSDRRYLL
jgi:hypothetical protein